MFGDGKARLIRKIAKGYMAAKFSMPQGGGLDALYTALADPTQSNYLNQLFDVVETDPGLARIMTKHAATRSDLEAVFTGLYMTIGSRKIRGHYVPFSTLAYPASLDFALAEKDNLGYAQQDRLVAFFERGRKGSV